MIFFCFICWCSSPAVLIQFEAEKNDVDHISIQHLHPGILHSTRPAQQMFEGSNPKWQRTWAPTTHVFFSAEGLRGAGANERPLTSLDYGDQVGCHQVFVVTSHFMGELSDNNRWYRMIVSK